ncbi:hypothetical protein AVEN_114299-1 [Araneus ventricosus]|uniref:WD repeat domain phosphoinositide-interacting protein 2 n=1 Tax=Araneus ventricosus TaxID=182803 RepID=A0A4Y2MKQ7_ARAVE|nr:hypothetical protein AVEN_238124-1 [Araneus ventricosus]GBN27783.1 hypothetical protein AVEN_114299-1 [Araneus ventricosus]
MQHAKITIPAHNSALAALAFDESGEKIATASIKGTVIRIFSVAKGEQLYEFRRGVKSSRSQHHTWVGDTIEQESKIVSSVIREHAD